MNKQNLVGKPSQLSDLSLPAGTYTITAEAKYNESDIPKEFSVEIEIEVQ